MASRTSRAPWKNRASSNLGSKKTSSSSSIVWPACWASTRLCQVKKATRSLGSRVALMCSRPSSSSCQKPGGGPVLDGEAGPFGDLAVLAAVEPLQLVAEVERVRPAVAALAHVVEAQPERFAHGEQPLEMRRAEPEDAAVDGPLGADQLGVALAVLGFLVDGPA